MKFVPFDSVFFDSTSRYIKIKKEDYKAIGKYPIIDQGQEFIGGYTNDESIIVKENAPVIIFGDHTKVFKYIDFPFTIGADGVKVLKLKNKAFNTLFYFHFFKRLKIVDKGYSRHFKYLKEKLLPMPEKASEQLHIANLLTQAETLIARRKESIRLLDEYLKSVFLEMFGDPVRNEKGWRLFEFIKLGNSRLGKMLDGKKIIGENLKPYLRNSNVQWFSFKLDDLLEMDFDEKDSIEFGLKKGDILMCEGGEIGRCAIWKEELSECYFQKAIHRIRLNSTIVLPEWFVYMFWQYKLKGGLNKFTGAATIAHLTGEKLKNLKLPIPPIDLQIHFTNIVDNIETLKSQYRQSLAELENLYGSLSQRAFGGISTK